MAESGSNICRICLQQIEENVQFYFLNDNGVILQSKLLDFLPEIALNATQNPIICNRCTITIDGVHEFKPLCLRTESIIEDLKMQQTPFEDILNYVKEETVHETFKEELVDDTTIDEPQILDDNVDLPVCIEAPTKPLFYCYTCNYNTDLKRSLARHVHTHRPQLPKIRRFKCDECSYTTLKNYCLTAHKKIHLKTESIITDLKMQQHFEDVLNCVKKNIIHETIKEELVDDTIIKDEPQIVDDDCLLVNTDLPICIDAAIKPLFCCDTCNYNTDTKTNLTRHVYIHHPRQCNICDFKCITRSKLALHMRSHTREKPIKKVYQGKKRFYQLSHSNVKSYKCDQCDYSSALKRILKNHVIYTHNREKLVKIYKCGECDYSSMFKKNLEHHLMHRHYREKMAKNLKCGECDYSSVNKYCLKRHVIRMHNREKIAKNHKCGECDYSSKFKDGLKNHVIHVHNREKLVKNHKCGECEYATVSKAALVTHIRSHTGEKPYMCNICDFRFAQTSHLKTHLNTHTSEKPLKCQLCSYSCTPRRLMKNHQQQHLKKPVLDCDKCSFKTLHNFNLKQHQLIHIEESL